MRSSLEEAMQRHRSFSAFPEEPVVEEDDRCDYAKQYEGYLVRVCSDAFKHPTFIGINEAYLDCFLKYMELRNLVPKSHRNCVDERASHRCIFHVMERYFYELRI